jgi:catechol 2,3-dioxygenase-like lactoylglutathione lyase family enzyme
MIIQVHSNENYCFNHVAISVPNCDEAVDWYMKVFGFRRIRSDRATDRKDEPNAPIFKIYPNQMHKVKSAWLTCGNSVGFEVFEFSDPSYKKTEAFEEGAYARGGFFHIAITCKDPDATAKLASQHGGKQIGETVSMYGEKALYLQDPWGNVIEWQVFFCRPVCFPLTKSSVSCTFDQLMGNRG